MVDTHTQIPWEDFASAYAFLGNSFLCPMRETGAFGTKGSFWEGFLIVEDESLRMAVNDIVLLLENRSSSSENELVAEFSREHAWLFVGPPAPRVYPWESLIVSGGIGPAFGRHALEMRTLLHQAGLTMKTPGSQPEDHVGIELLYLSTLCSRENPSAEDAVSFMDTHLLRWLNDFREQISSVMPGGYYDSLGKICLALCNAHRNLLIDAVA